MKRFTLLFIAFLTLAISGCAGQSHYRNGVYVTMAPPPPPVVGYVGRPPSREHVWVDGYWRWNGYRHEWVSGYWTRPPHRHARWAPGYWRHERRGYIWIEGRWR